MEEYLNMIDENIDLPEIQESEPFYGGEDCLEENSHSDNSELTDSISNNIGGRYECTCGCTHFNDIGGNMCSCGHSWWNHKFWKEH